MTRQKMTRAEYIARNITEQHAEWLAQRKATRAATMPTGRDPALPLVVIANANAPKLPATIAAAIDAIAKDTRP